MEKLSGTEYEITDLAAGQSTKVNVADQDLQFGSLLRFKLNGEDKLVQFLESKEGMNFKYYFHGNTVDIEVYDQQQKDYKKYMAPPAKIDYAKLVQSPMPGSIVSLSVEVGQTVMEGQELCIIEAMKMQNIIKSQVEGKVKKINIKAAILFAIGPEPLTGGAMVTSRFSSPPIRTMPAPTSRKRPATFSNVDIF